MKGLNSFIGLSSRCYMTKNQYTDKGERSKTKVVFTTEGAGHIPPTEDVLHQHTLRAVYQGGLVWGQCLQTKPALPSPSVWGWTKDVGHHAGRPLWTTPPQTDDSCYKLIPCWCKQECKNRSKCINASHQSTALRSCGGHCEEDHG